MNRRRLLIGLATGVSSALAGCVAESDERESEQAVDEPESEANDESPDADPPSCWYHVELLDDPPEDAPVVSATEHDLLEVSLLERIFDKATDPDADHARSHRPSGRYEQFSVSKNSTAELEAARTALDSLPRYRDTDYPPGVYVENNGTVAAIAESCLT